jgi:hypothetical protein
MAPVDDVFVIFEMRRRGEDGRRWEMEDGR